MSEWISVDDRLPELHSEVWVSSRSMGVGAGMVASSKHGFVSVYEFGRDGYEAGTIPDLSFTTWQNFMRSDYEQQRPA